MPSGDVERKLPASMDAEGVTVVPITDPIVYPLHRRRLSFAHRYGQTVGYVVGAVLCFLGLMFLGSVVRERSTSAVVIGTAAVVLGVVTALAGRAVGAVRSSSGMITVQPDRLEIADDRAFDRPILLRRDRIMSVCSPGMVDDQPPMRVHIRATHDVMRLGEQQPNLEIWLATPIERPGPPAPRGRAHRPVAVIELLTPGAGTVIRWFREGLHELAPPKWYEN